MRQIKKSKTGFVFPVFSVVFVIFVVKEFESGFGHAVRTKKHLEGIQVFKGKCIARGENSADKAVRPAIPTPKSYRPFGL